jgi:hypothetical protein
MTISKLVAFSTYKDTVKKTWDRIYTKLHLIFGVAHWINTVYEISCVNDIYTKKN